MNQKRRLIGWASGILALWLLVSSCGLINTTRVGATRTDAQAVELGSADQARIQIKMEAGKLTVKGGAEALMQATFRYNVADWRPHVEYSVNGSQGELLVDHSGEDIPIGGELVNEWNLSLNNLVPIDLEIETGAGETALDMRGVDLTDLHVQIGAGNTSIDLSSALDHNLSAAIKGGVGELSVRLPGEMGVRVSAATGIGNLTNSGLVKDGDHYVNGLYGSSPHTLFLDIDAGVGGIELLAP